MDAEKTVRQFCSAISRCKSAELASFFSDDAVYHNIPLEPVQGREMIQATLAQFVDISTDAAFEVLALATSGNKVLTERVDRFTINGKPVAIPVMGTFEVDANGKISAWRDYFDMQQFMKQIS